MSSLFNQWAGPGMTRELAQLGMRECKVLPKGTAGLGDKGGQSSWPRQHKETRSMYSKLWKHASVRTRTVTISVSRLFPSTIKYIPPTMPHTSLDTCSFSFETRNQGPPEFGPPPKELHWLTVCSLYAPNPLSSPKAGSGYVIKHIYLPMAPQ